MNKQKYRYIKVFAGATWPYDSPEKFPVLLEKSQLVYHKEVILHQPQSLGMRARNLIEELILEGTLATGTKITERDLADRLGMSRAPIRDAIKELIADGLLHRLGTRCIVVRELKLREIDEIYSIRKILEARAAFLAASRITPNDMNTLIELHECMKEAAHESLFSEYYELNIRFHQIIHQASESPRLANMIETVMKESLLFRSRGLVDQSNLVESIAEHEMILRALKTRDAELAELCMHRHISGGLTRLRLR